MKMTYLIIIFISIGAISCLNCNAQTNSQNTLTWKKKGSPPEGVVREITINNQYAGCYIWKNNIAKIYDPNTISEENCNSTLFTSHPNLTTRP